MVVKLKEMEKENQKKIKFKLKLNWSQKVLISVVIVVKQFVPAISALFFELIYFNKQVIPYYHI